MAILSAENLCSASRRHIRGSIESTRVIASAICSAPLTKNPVRPSLTISSRAPLRNAITGVPDASASIAKVRQCPPAFAHLKRPIAGYDTAGQILTQCGRGQVEQVPIAAVLVQAQE